MTFRKSLCFVVLASSLMPGQNTSTTTPASDNIADDLRKLRDAVTEQQKQIAQQQQQIQKLEQQLAAKRNATAWQGPTVKQDTNTRNDGLSPRFVDASLRTSRSSASAAAQPAANTQTQPQQPEAQGAKSPLSFRIGAAEFTPGGFVDFENIFRSTNTGNVSATNFAAIPFSNTVNGHLTEYRSTGQYSRFNLKTTTQFGKNDVTGYVEFDFNGNDATNVFVTSNPHTSRLRLYWLDLRRGKWEFLGGQTWGLQTPNRVGVSPNPADLALTYNEDAQVHVGFNPTRAGEFRAAYHFNDNWAWAVAIQNPQQYAGTATTVVTYPSAFNVQITGGNGQFDNGTNAGIPNLVPDLHTKLAYDNTFGGGRTLHFEGGGLLTTARITILPTATGATFHSNTIMGEGVLSALSVELWKGSDNRDIMFVGSGMWGYGIGRYLIGMAPQAIVKPSATSAGFDASLSGVHSGNAIVGVEFRPHPKSQFSVYGGAVYAQRNFACDITAAGAGACNGKPFIGFGFPGSANTANRTGQEATIDWTQTFWKNPQYGAVLLVTQASYVSRSPWFVSAGAPKNAHLGMGFLSLRYVLP